MEREFEIRKNWSVAVDEDLTMEERKLRWRIMEKAREERRKGREEILSPSLPPHLPLFIPLPFISVYP